MHVIIINSAINTLFFRIFYYRYYQRSGNQICQYSYYVYCKDDLKEGDIVNIVQANFSFRNSLTPLNLSNVKYIVVHHAAALYAKPEEIHQWHLGNGWAGFGYNEYIRKDGTVYIGRGDNVGAHCYGYNSVSYGICCEGNYSKEVTLSQELLNSLIERLKFHKKRFPYSKIVGHRELYNTECPGNNFPLKDVINKTQEELIPKHWAYNDNYELMLAGILYSDHSETLDNPATEGMVIALVNRIRKEGKKL